MIMISIYFFQQLEQQTILALFLPTPIILSWGFCGTPFDTLTPNSGSV